MSGNALVNVVGTVTPGQVIYPAIVVVHTSWRPPRPPRFSIAHPEQPVFFIALTFNRIYIKFFECVRAQKVGGGISGERGIPLFVLPTDVHLGVAPSASRQPAMK